MATTRLGSMSASLAKKISKNPKKPRSKSSKGDPKMDLKGIAKKRMSNVADVVEASGSKKRHLPSKVEARKAKRIKSLNRLRMKVFIFGSRKKISSDLVELKEFVSFAAQMATMQTQFSSVFADSIAKDKASDSSNNDGGSDNEEDIDSEGN
uniref:Uncharacterized protein n=1 Tax=Cannabis sativa TaxID=3483 RepID=A0A803QJD4_CANSA